MPRTTGHLLRADWRHDWVPMRIVVVNGTLSLTCPEVLSLGFFILQSE